MAEVGGAGYVLILLGLFTGITLLLGVILSSVAWIKLGRKLKDRVMLGNGIVMLSSPVVFVVITMAVGYMFGTILPISHMLPPMPLSKMVILDLYLKNLKIYSAVCFTSVLHILAHLRAGTKLGIRAFRLSGFFQILSIAILLVAMVPKPFRLIASIAA